jgi:hypothetical protein
VGVSLRCLPPVPCCSSKSALGGDPCPGKAASASKNADRCLMRSDARSGTSSLTVCSTRGRGHCHSLRDSGQKMRAQLTHSEALRFDTYVKEAAE